MRYRRVFLGVLHKSCTEGRAANMIANQPKAVARPVVSCTRRPSPS